MLAALREGDWLTLGRLRLWALAVLLASAAAVAYLIASSDGLNDYQGRPLGTDFANIYVAGTQVLEGRPEAPFDPRQQFARAQAIFGPDTPFYGWHYPPLFHPIAAALASMPYLLALTVWQGLTLALYLLAMRAIVTRVIPPPKGEAIVCTHLFAASAAGVDVPSPPVGEGSTEVQRRRMGEGFSPAARTPHPSEFADASELPSPTGGEGTMTVTSLAARSTSRLRRCVNRIAKAESGEHSEPGGALTWLLLALAFPAVLVNLGHGHNGFLTAALVGLALVWLDRRPWLAGLLFGLLAYKPQLGLMIPLVLAATGRWRVILAAAATVVALTLAVTLAFGLDTWRAFFGSFGFTRLVLEQGGPGWHMIQSLFSALRMWGAPLPLAYAAQGALTLAIAAALIWLWRAPVAFALKAAALCIATLLATPYSLDYDMMLLAPAIAFLAVDGLQRGFAPYQKTALAALWIVPLIARSVAQTTLLPIGLAVMLLLLLLTLDRARRDLGALPHRKVAAAP